jgi:hypothetical protein
MTRFYAIVRSFVCCVVFFAALVGAFAQGSLAVLSPSSLVVADPRGAWNRQGQGCIEEALLTVTPCGVYAKCELFLTFSARGTALTSAKDSLEVQLNFTLPLEAHVTDSWLWVGDSIVQAKIFDRTSASTVYETIVQRRRDPSLLIKNSPGYFNLRIFPMRGNETRKVKISYLIPSEWSETSVNALLPLSIMKASSLVPNLSIIYYPQEDWATPRISLQPETGSGSTSNRFRETQDLQTGRKVYATTLSGDEVRKNETGAFRWENPARNGVFVQTFTRNGEQFYHLAVIARQVLGVGQSDSVELDNLRLSGSNGNCYDRYTLNLPPVYPSWYGIGRGILTPTLGIYTPTPQYTFGGTRRIDKNGVIHEVGRFSGDGGLTMRLGGYVNKIPFGIERTIPRSAMREGGACSFLSWLGNHLTALENEPMRYGFNSNVDTAWQTRQKSIVQQSVEHRVLSRLTAFLALEPNDTTRSCNTCTQPSTGSPAVAGTGAPSGAAIDVAAASRMANFATSPTAQMYSSTYAPPYTLAVAPNPSNAAATLTLTLLTPLDIDVSSVNAGIYDALGRCVRMIPPSILASWLKQGQISVLWNGDDDAGRDVAPGAYFLVVQTPSARQAVKILRW